MKQLLIEGESPRYVNIRFSDTGELEMCKRLDCGNETIWRAEMDLPDSDWMQYGPWEFTTNGAHTTMRYSEVKWDCRGYDKLSFDLIYKHEHNCYAANLQAYFNCKSYNARTLINVHAYASQTSVHFDLDISGFTEDEKSKMYVSAYMYATPTADTVNGIWTNKTAVMACQAVNVVASY